MTNLKWVTTLTGSICLAQFVRPCFSGSVSILSPDLLVSRSRRRNAAATGCRQTSSGLRVVIISADL